MGNIIGVERRGYSVYLRNQNNGYLELIYRTPSQPERCMGIYEEQNMASALDEYHMIASVVAA